MRSFGGTGLGFSYQEGAGSDGVPAGGTPPAGGAPAPGGAPPPAWDAGFDADTRAFSSTKGWKSPVDVISGYRNLEKLVGAPADSVLRLPKEGDADYEQRMGQVYDRLGRPKDASGYKLTIPEGHDPAFAGKAAEWFHKRGVPAKMAEGIVDDWNAYTAQAAATHKAEQEAKWTQEDQALKTAWGGMYEKNERTAGAVARHLGMTADHITAIEGALGFAATMKLFHGLAQQLGEDKFVTAGAANQGGGMTPEDAQARINLLKNDKEFSKKLTSGDAQAKAEWDRLHKFLV